MESLVPDDYRREDFLRDLKVARRLDGPTDPRRMRFPTNALRRP
jgi:hypothetical protein